MMPSLYPFNSTSEVDYPNVEELSVQPFDEDVHEEPKYVSELLTNEDEQMCGSLR